MYYDPMVAKLCTWAPTRLEAIDAMSDALDGFVVDGIEHNVPFLAALMRHPRWREGRLSTGFIAEEYPDGFVPTAPSAEETTILARVALSAHLVDAERRSHHLDRLRPTAIQRYDWVVKIGDAYHALTAGDAVESDWRPGETVWRGTIGERGVTAQLRPFPNGMRIDWQGLSVRTRVFTPRLAELDALMPVKLPPDTSKMLLCPMPGLVVSIAVSEGQEVKAGETLAVVEAMKMENVLRAERDLTVGPVRAKPGESLAVDAVIMEFA
jgi:propionyl-CoA carboxylase alpha chain